MGSRNSTRENGDANEEKQGARRNSNPFSFERRKEKKLAEKRERELSFLRQHGPHYANHRLSQTLTPAGITDSRYLVLDEAGNIQFLNDGDGSGNSTQVPSEAAVGGSSSKYQDIGFSEEESPAGSSSRANVEVPLTKNSLGIKEIGFTTKKSSGGNFTQAPIEASATESFPAYEELTFNKCAGGSFTQPPVRAPVADSSSGYMVMSGRNPKFNSDRYIKQSVNDKITGYSPIYDDIEFTDKKFGRRCLPRLTYAAPDADDNSEYMVMSGRNPKSNSDRYIQQLVRDKIAECSPTYDNVEFTDKKFGKLRLPRLTDAAPDADDNSEYMVMSGGNPKFNDDRYIRQSVKDEIAECSPTYDNVEFTDKKFGRGSLPRLTYAAPDADGNSECMVMSGGNPKFNDGRYPRQSVKDEIAECSPRYENIEFAGKKFGRRSSSRSIDVAAEAGSGSEFEVMGDMNLKFTDNKFIRPLMKDQFAGCSPKYENTEFTNKKFNRDSFTRSTDVTSNKKSTFKCEKLGSTSRKFKKGKFNSGRHLVPIKEYTSGYEEMREESCDEKFIKKGFTRSTGKPSVMTCVSDKEIEITNEKINQIGCTRPPFEPSGTECSSGSEEVGFPKKEMGRWCMNRPRLKVPEADCFPVYENIEFTNKKFHGGSFPRAASETPKAWYNLSYDECSVSNVKRSGGSLTRAPVRAPVSTRINYTEIEFMNRKFRRLASPTTSNSRYEEFGSTNTESIGGGCSPPRFDAYAAWNELLYEFSAAKRRFNEASLNRGPVVDPVVDSSQLYEEIDFTKIKSDGNSCSQAPSEAECKSKKIDQCSSIPASSCLTDCISEFSTLKFINRKFHDWGALRSPAQAFVAAEGIPDAEKSSKGPILMKTGSIICASLNVGTYEKPKCLKSPINWVDDDMYVCDAEKCDDENILVTEL